MSIDTKAIRARVKKTSNGPWSLGEAGNCNVVRFDGDDVTGIANAHWDNADFIAAARTDVPALCDEVDSLRAQLDNYMEVHVDDVMQLAAAQAKEAELRAAAALVVACERADWMHDTFVGRGRWGDAVHACVRAIALAPDDSALREFGLRVARLAYDAGLERPIPHADFKALVDAVLRDSR